MPFLNVANSINAWKEKIFPINTNNKVSIAQPVVTAFPNSILNCNVLPDCHIPVMGAPPERPIITQECKNQARFLSTYLFLDNPIIRPLSLKVITTFSPSTDDTLYVLQRDLLGSSMLTSIHLLSS